MRFFITRVLNVRKILVCSVFYTKQFLWFINIYAYFLMLKVVERVTRWRSSLPVMVLPASDCPPCTVQLAAPLQHRHTFPNSFSHTLLFSLYTRYSSPLSLFFSLSCFQITKFHRVYNWLHTFFFLSCSHQRLLHSCKNLQPIFLDKCLVQSCFDTFIDSQISFV